VAGSLLAHHEVVQSIEPLTGPLEGLDAASPPHS